MGNITLDTEIHFTYKHLNSNIQCTAINYVLSILNNPFHRLGRKGELNFK